MRRGRESARGAVGVSEGVQSGQRREEVLIPSCVTDVEVLIFLAARHFTVHCVTEVEAAVTGIVLPICHGIWSWGL